MEAAKKTSELYQGHLKVEGHKAEPIGKSFVEEEKVVGDTRLELVTSAMSRQRSNHLS